jgi:hypothetical protein
MEDAAFSDDFCRFIQTALPAVDAAELLLLLAEHGDEWWDARSAIERLRPSTTISEADATRYLELFQARALIAVGPDRRVQFRPGTEELASYVQTLAQAYKERPVTLIRVIYALRDTKIQSFADAFRLKRK